MSPAKKHKPLIPYLRQSRSKEKTVTFEEQRADIRRWAEGEGVTLTDEVIERGVSGNRAWRERELGDALARVEAGEASGIIVAYQSRLSRENNLATAEVWEAMKAAKARLVCVAEAVDATAGGTPEDEFIFTLHAGIARLEWRKHEAAWKRRKHDAWTKGKYVADAPAGYDRSPTGGLTPNEHADAILEAFRVKANGGTWLAVANVLTAAQVPTSGGHGRKGTTKWTREGVRSVILRQTYYGLHACTCGCGEEIIRPEWDILEGKRLWKRAQPTTTEPTVRHHGLGHTLGGGLVRCGTCDRGLIKSSTKAGKYKLLRCPGRGSGHVSMSYPVTEDWIVGVAFAHEGITVEHEGGNADEVEAADADLALAQEALSEVEALRGKIGAASFGLAHSDASAAVEAAQDARDDLVPDGGEHRLIFPVGNRKKFAALEIPEQRAALRSIVARAVIAPGRGTPSERVVVEFVDGSYHPAHAAPGWQPVELDESRVVTTEEFVEEIRLAQLANAAADAKRAAELAKEGTPPPPKIVAA